MLQDPRTGGILLIAIAALAMAWANSDASALYFALRELPVGGSLFGFTISRSLEWFVNDVVMTVFFFTVGLEIRGEIHHGALREWRRAVLPIAAAIGGMVVPAGVYLLIAGAPSTARGWGVPMATDIAFALGILALLGARVPASLRVLLLALAVIDDLGATLVIAIFYSTGFELHPAIAGVVVGTLIPVSRHEGESLSERLLHALQPWVTFAIMPLFALTNAGVALGALELSGDALSAASGVALGLVLGKPIGVVLASLLVVKLGVATLPSGIGARQLIVLGLAAGIGFTMALFIAQLAFTDATLLAAAKLAVLIASVLAAVLGLVAGLLLLPRPTAS